MRDTISDYHKEGDTKDIFDDLIQRISERKVKRYRAVVNGYKRFLGRKSITWFAPPKGHWTASGLDVIVNPELGLMIDDHPYVIKLYFKDEKITARNVTVIQALMMAALAEDVPENTTFVVLDVERGKLFPVKGGEIDQLPLLIAEAHSFSSIWGALAC